ncbi:MAG: hypothetical protein WBA13_18210 [Microcoleaceae cyanobacterium]
MSRKPQFSKGQIVVLDDVAYFVIVEHEFINGYWYYDIQSVGAGKVVMTSIPERRLR